MVFDRLSLQYFRVMCIFLSLLIDMFIIVLDFLLIKRMYFLWANYSVSLH